MKTNKHQTERLEKLAYWEPHISAWRTSGQSATEYCQSHELNVHQFRYWQYQIAPKTKRGSSKSIKADELVELLPPSSSRPPSEGYLDFQHPMGLSIRISGPLSTEQWSELFHIVQALSC